jgi:hypothetical protein
MGKQLKRHFLLFVVLFWAGLGTVGASTFLQLQSSYLGDGWFQYRMNVLSDPFFSQVNVTGIQIGFTNETEHGTSATNWTNTNWTNGYSSWAFDSGTSPQPPFEVTWMIQSAETSYKLQTNLFNGDAIVTSFLDMATKYVYPGIASNGVVSQNVIGCANMPCLVPCPPEEGDNSPTNFVYDLKLAPDVVIQQLVQTNGEIHGVDFGWDSDATFVLQGTTDFKNWTNITYVWSYPPETIWATNQSLNNLGSFFRLQLVTDGHSTNLAPLVSNLKVTPKLPLKPLLVTGCRLTDGNMVVGISSSPGQICYVQALDSRLIVRQSQQVTSSGTANASFDPAGLPNPVFFRAVLSP